MGTPFEEIYDLALINIRDYKIDYLYKTDISAFNDYMMGFLIKSVPKFSGCLNSLEYDIILRQFNSSLSMKEKDILADFVVITWMESNTNDATQINLHLQGRDKKNFSEDANLKGKSERLDRMREKVRQDICDYQLDSLY